MTDFDSAQSDNDRVLIARQDDGIATLLLNEGSRRNPTSLALLDAMDAGLDRLEADASVRVILVRGEGRAFCAGLDLDEVRAGDEIVHRLLSRLSQVMRRLRRSPCVTIAVVQGAAIGGGFGFAAASDLLLTHPEAKLGYPPASIGLSPALMAPWLVRRIGPSRARAMLLEGGTISGEEAYRRGIVDRLAAEADLVSQAEALARTVISAPQHAAAEMKGFLNDMDDSLADTWLDRAAAVSARVIAHPETQARVQSMVRS